MNQEIGISEPKTRPSEIGNGDNPWRDVPADMVRGEFSDMHLAAERCFQCCPSIEYTAGGRLWAVWISGGMTEPQIDNFGVVAYSDDGGKTWIDPYFIVEHIDVQQVRINYITLWLDEQERLWICWSQTAGDWSMKENAFLSSFAVCVEHPDAEIPVCGMPMYMFPALLHNKPTRLSTGEWLFATEHIFRTDFSFVYAAEHMGETPVLRGTVHSRTAWKVFHEARIIEKENGVLWILSRIEGGMFGGMEEAFSDDAGKTWTEFEMNLPDPLRGPGARFHIRRLKSGRLLLLNHDNERCRSGLSAFLSDDDGRTWTQPYVIDAREDVSYPDACEAEDGRILVIYDRNRTTDAEILLVSLTEEEILCRGEEPVRYVISRRRK